MWKNSPFLKWMPFVELEWFDLNFTNPMRLKSNSGVKFCLLSLLSKPLDSQKTKTAEFFYKQQTVLVKLFKKSQNNNFILIQKSKKVQYYFSY